MHMVMEEQKKMAKVETELQQLPEVLEAVAADAMCIIRVSAPGAWHTSCSCYAFGCIRAVLSTICQKSSHHSLTCGVM